MNSDPWRCEVVSGSAALLHDQTHPEAPERTLWLLQVTEPAVVLGSAQSAGLVASHPESPVDVVRRHSGGGAVWVEPGCGIWIDFFVPRSDPLWNADIARSAFWVGEAWRDALSKLTGTCGEVHRGGFQADRWGRLLCFAGRGPGEVFIDGAKVVGVSQRRTRDWIRLQTLAYTQPERSSQSERDELDVDQHHEDRHSRLLAVLALGDAERLEGRAVLQQRCSSIRADGIALYEAVVAAASAHARG